MSAEIDIVRTMEASSIADIQNIEDIHYDTTTETIMIESELKKLTPSARAAVLKLEKQNKIDEQELRDMQFKSLARLELGLQGVLLHTAAAAYVDARSLLEEYTDRIKVQAGETQLTLGRGKLSVVHADYLAAVHKHMAKIAENLRDRTHALEGIANTTKRAMVKYYNQGKDENEVESLVGVACETWMTYVGKDWKPALVLKDAVGVKL